MTKVLLADDHPFIVAAVESLLDGTGYQLVAKASTGAEALEAIERENPDIVILDVQMPDGTGLDILRKLRARSDDRKVILLTASLDDQDFAEALTLKCDGVLLKGSDPAFLLDCLNEVRDGESWIDPQLDGEAATLAAQQPRVPLAPRERELVALVREGLRNREIAERLGVTEGTVKVYMHAVFEKTGVANRIELALRAAEWIGS